MTTGPQAECGVNNGFLADLEKDYQLGRYWTEITNWRTGAGSLYNAGRTFVDQSGRFTPHEDGYFLCIATLRMDNHHYSYYSRLNIAVNGNYDLQNGQTVMEGDGGSTNYRTMTVSGTMQLRKADYVSLWVYSNSDDSWKIHSESGFSCNRFSTPVGFHADKVENLLTNTQWRGVTDWRTVGSETLYDNGNGFQEEEGRFYAPLQGVYYCYANMRFDSGSRGYYFQTLITLNEEQDLNNGLFSREGNLGSNNHRHMVVYGTLNLKSNDFVSVYVYSNGDNSWYVHDESGFGCHFLDTKVGFLSDETADKLYGKNWNRVNGWSTVHNNELYALGGEGPDDNGEYIVHKNGFYVCYANLQIDDHTSGSQMRAMISIDRSTDVDMGLAATHGDRESTNYRSVRVGGTVWLKKGSKISVYVFSQGDNSWKVKTNSGFGCHKFAEYTCTSCPPNSAGTNLDAGCKCKDGYIGKIQSKKDKNGGYTGECMATKTICGENYGFNADKKGSQAAHYRWNEVSTWEDPSKTHTYNTGGSVRHGLSFNPQSGHFTAIEEGYFLCSTNLRIDNLHYGGLSRVMIAINGNTDVQNGMTTTEGDGGSTNHRSMRVSGTIKLKKAQYTSVWAYTNYMDNSWNIHDESSFSCHKLESSLGFHADKDNDQSMGTNWRQVTGWRVAGTDGLYSAKGVIVKTIYKSGTNKQSQSARNSEIIEGTLEVAKGVAYTVKAEVLRNDLASASEKLTSLTLNGKSLFDSKGCNPPGSDYACDFWKCPVLKNFVAQSTTGTIAVRMDFDEHSWDCDCDPNTWECAKENTIPGTMPMEAAVRFTLTPKTIGELLGCSVAYGHRYHTVSQRLMALGSCLGHDAVYWFVFNRHTPISACPSSNIRLLRADFCLGTYAHVVAACSYRGSHPFSCCACV